MKSTRAQAVSKSESKTKPVEKRRAVVVQKGTEIVGTLVRPLTASSLKNILWETLCDIKHENMLPSRGDAIAAQAREILRTVKIQLQIAGQAKREVPTEIVEFTERRS